MSLHRPWSLSALALLAWLPLGTALAGDQVNASTGMTLAGAPLAIHGYDAVAYFNSNQAQIGSAAFTVKYQGAAFRFVNEENKRAFEKQPAHYAPQFGGFCAYGVALGAKFDGDPRLFAIVDGKLYFNLSPDIQKKWQEDVAGNIKKADANWPKIEDKAPSQL